MAEGRGGKRWWREERMHVKAPRLCKGVRGYARESEAMQGHPPVRVEAGHEAPPARFKSHPKAADAGGAVAIHPLLLRNPKRHHVVHARSVHAGPVVSHLEDGPAAVACLGEHIQLHKRGDARTQRGETKQAQMFRQGAPQCRLQRSAAEGMRDRMWDRARRQGAWRALRRRRRS